MMFRPLAAFVSAAGALLLAAVFVSGSAAADDRHAGYYYPAPGQAEEYIARAPALAGSDRKRRLAFVSGIIQEITAKPYPPTYAIFAKGASAEKLMIISVREGYYDTLYRARALLAALTSLARATPLFRDLDEDDRYTFFDLCYMLGFEQLTISDGKTFAHQVRFVAPPLTPATGG